MFGYVRPEKNELKLKEIRQYSSYYCALCDCLQKEFGWIYRLILSNDCTFLFICLNAVMDRSSLETIRSRCPGKPFRRKKSFVNVKALRFAAQINFYLFYRKIIDGIHDSPSKLKRLALRLLLTIITRKKGFKQLISEHPDMYSHAEQMFEQLNQNEHSDSSFDVLTNQFGKIVACFVECFCTAEKIPSMDALKSIFFNLAKWIYLADAFDDLEEDQRKNEFNLLHLLVPDGNKREMQETVVLLLAMIQQKSLSAFGSVQWKRDSEMIRNMLSDGTSAILRKLIRKKQKGRKRDVGK